MSSLIAMANLLLEIEKLQERGDMKNLKPQINHKAVAAAVATKIVAGLEGLRGLHLKKVDNKFGVGFDVNNGVPFQCRIKSDPDPKKVTDEEAKELTSIDKVVNHISDYVKKSAKDFSEAGYKIKSVSEPGPLTPGLSSSSTFRSVKVMLTQKSQPDIYVELIATKTGAGPKFEKIILAKLSDALHTNAADGLAAQALEALNAVKKHDFSLDNIASIKARSGNTTRTGIEIKDSGEIIGDIVITLNKPRKEIYISVKDIDGLTFHNQGIVGHFDATDLTFDESSETFKNLLEPLGIDNETIKKGMGIYQDKMAGLKVAGIEHQDTIKLDKKVSKKSAIYKHLKKAWGAEYYYLKKESSGFKAFYVDTAKVDEMLKDLKITRVLLPGKTRKQITIELKGKGIEYKLEIRNTKGGISPSQVNAQVKIANK